MKKKSLLCLCLLFSIISSIAQNICYPSNWWVGMKMNKIQLLLHNVSGLTSNNTKASIQYAGIQILKQTKVENKNYLFLDIEILPTAKPGMTTILLSDGDQKNNKSFLFELKQRNGVNGVSYAQGVTSADFIYMLMPDRFANGNPTNDKFADLRDTNLNRNNPLMRHGGDLQGINDHLNYFKDLGATTLWLTPIVENNMPLQKESVGWLSGYHGYWITDHYTLDKRYGTNYEYIKLVTDAHKNGLKIIQDIVYNHVGSQHWFVLDPPTKDWLNIWPHYQVTNHREEAAFDEHGNKRDKNVLINGWFTEGLPDLNLANPLVANYMIQNTIWSVENFGIDGLRVDTYKYCDENFLNNINNALIAEFPKLTVFGEAWVNSVVASAYYCQNNIDLPFKHNLQGVCDFPLSFSMLDAVKQTYGWTEGFNRLYMTLSQDVLYKNPMRNCIFLDNHDTNRFLSEIGEDMNKYKMALTWLLTLRGIPQLYYGTEVLMKNYKNPSDGMVRLDFSGGWQGDSTNKFTSAGRTTKENDAYDFIKKLANFRKSSSAIKTGKLMQFAPYDGIYVYFRYDDKQTIMVASNSNDTPVTLDMTRFEEITKPFSSIKNVMNGELNTINKITIAAKQSVVAEMVK